MSSDKNDKIGQLKTVLKNKNNKSQLLESELNNLISIKFIFHPIKKYKQYKQLVKTYYSLK